jgi:hypothetical protein
MALRGVGDLVVGFARDGDRVSGVNKLLHARRGKGEDLHVDAGSVHRAEPTVAEVA